MKSNVSRKGVPRKSPLTMTLVACLIMMASIHLSCNRTGSGKISDSIRVEPVTNSASQTASTQINPPVIYGDGDVVHAALLDRSGNMWFGTSREGVFKYDGEKFINFRESNGLCDDEVSAIIEDDEGVIWFGTGRGLCNYNGDSFQYIPIPNIEINTNWLKEAYPIVNPNGVLSLLQDRSGVLWIGSNGAGAYRYDPKTKVRDGQVQFTSFLKNRGNLQPDSLHHNVITSILEDDSGNIWFTSFSHGGLSMYDGKTMHHFGVEDGLADDMISTSYKTKSGQIWFGTRSAGMSRFDGSTFSTLYEPQGPCHNNMARMLEDREGRFWIGSFARSGVCWFDGESFTPFQAEGSEHLKDVKCIAEDGKGNIWFGGRYGILWRYDGESLTDFSQKGQF